MSNENVPDTYVNTVEKKSPEQMALGILMGSERFKTPEGQALLVLIKTMLERQDGIQVPDDRAVEVSKSPDLSEPIPAVQKAEPDPLVIKQEQEDYENIKKIRDSLSLSEEVVQSGRVLDPQGIHELLEATQGEIARDRIRALKAFYNKYVDGDQLDLGILKEKSNEANEDPSATPDEKATWAYLLDKVQGKPGDVAVEKDKVGTEIDLRQFDVLDLRELNGRSVEEILQSMSSSVKFASLAKSFRPELLEIEPDSDGIFVGVGKTSDDGLIVVPVVSRFSSSQDYSHFAHAYDCYSPGSGSLVVEVPAVYKKDGTLKSKGVLKVI